MKYPKDDHPSFQLESLEPRVLLSATFKHGQLTLLGSQQDDFIQIWPGEQAGQVIVSYDWTDENRDIFDNVRSIKIKTFGGNDSVQIYTALPGVDGQTINTIIDTGKGDDLIYAGGGHDLVKAGAGNDTVHGGSGNDHIFGGAGDDKIFGNEGLDVIYGGTGNDTLYASGSYIFIGLNDRSTDDSNDRIYGQAGNDTIVGSLGDNLLSGGHGDDALFGEEGNDKLLGGRGNDYLLGGEGIDLLLGGKGEDFLDDADQGTRIIDSRGQNIVPMTPLVQSLPDSSFKFNEPTTLLITSQRQLKKLTRFSRPGLFNRPGISHADNLDIDFTQYNLLIVAVGQRPTSGYEVAVKDITQIGNTLHVNAIESVPHPGESITQATTHPFQAVLIPKYNVNRIKNIELDLTTAGQGQLPVLRSISGEILSPRYSLAFIPKSNPMVPPDQFTLPSGNHVQLINSQQQLDALGSNDDIAGLNINFETESLVIVSINAGDDDWLGVQSITQHDFNLQVIAAKHTFVPIPEYNPFPWQSPIETIDIGSLSSLTKNIEYRAMVIPKTEALNLDMKVIGVRHYESFEIPEGGEKALQSAIDHLAFILGVDPELITPSSMYANTWQNENLGIGAFDGQPQSINPVEGYRITLEFDGIQCIYHTDTNKNLRFVGLVPEDAEPPYFYNATIISVITTPKDEQGVFQRITLTGSVSEQWINRTNQTLQYDDNGRLIELDSATMEAHRVIVALNPGYTFDDIQPLLESLDATVDQPRPTSSHFVYFDPFDLGKMDEVIQTLSQSPAIRYVEPNHYFRGTFLL